MSTDKRKKSESVALRFFVKTGSPHPGQRAICYKKACLLLPETKKTCEAKEKIF
jgi:hypothetical protein